MNDSDGIPLKEKIMQALQNCNDTNLLDFVYRLFLYDDMQEAGL